MGRPKKYSLSKFNKAVEKYFTARSITLYAKDGSGRIIENIEGNKIEYIDFAIPVSVSDLCRELGISRETWATYSKLDGYADTCAMAKTMIESWLERELLTRDRVDGIKFDLSCNYNWRQSDKCEIELGKDTRESIADAGVPMQDKLELIAAVFGKTQQLGERKDSAVSSAASPDVHTLGGVGYYDDDDTHHSSVDHSDRA